MPSKIGTLEKELKEAKGLKAYYTAMGLSPSDVAQRINALEEVINCYKTTGILLNYKIINTEGELYNV